MLSRLPRWVMLGASVLAGIAGMINVVGFLGFDRRGITHLTGTTSLLGAALAKGDAAESFHLFVILGAFVVGTTVSGIIIGDTALQLGRTYGIALFLESALLFISVPLFNAHSPWGAYCASAACGVQNAMATTFSGSVVRTTHVSGMFTDVGIAVGHALRGLPTNARRLKLSAIIITGFLAGGVVGALLFGEFGYSAIYFPASLTGLTAAAYSTHRLWMRLRH